MTDSEKASPMFTLLNFKLVASVSIIPSSSIHSITHDKNKFICVGGLVMKEVIEKKDRKKRGKAIQSGE